MLAHKSAPVQALVLHGCRIDTLDFGQAFKACSALHKLSLADSPCTSSSLAAMRFLTDLQMLCLDGHDMRDHATRKVLACSLYRMPGLEVRCALHVLVPFRPRGASACESRIAP